MLLCLNSYQSRILISTILFVEKTQLRTVRYKCAGVAELRTTIRREADFHRAQIQMRKLKNVCFVLNSSQLFYHGDCAFLSQ